MTGARKWTGEQNELRALLHLRALPALSDRALRALLARHGSARRALAAPATELGERAAAARGTEEVLTRVEHARKTIASLDLAVLREGDPRYPARLLELTDPPPVLFARGDLELLNRPAVAIVGARRASGYGLGAARRLASGLAGAGVVVVSGMALGIDAAAHAGALDGGTIGVLGCGIDVVHPPRHGALYEKVAARGLLVSEFLPGDPALPYHFPQRNRLIAALALGVVVVEAAQKSGSLITAEHALDLGREVFAVPGPIDHETSAGPNALIRDGARLVMGVQDILDELHLSPHAPRSTPAAADGGALTGSAHPPPALAGEALALWRALGDVPLHIEPLCEAAAVDPTTGLVQLLELELAGLVRQLDGMRFVRGRG
jgi:DNA processing protein